jgi:transcription elongation GreA/GreB family factor
MNANPRQQLQGIPGGRAPQQMPQQRMSVEQARKQSNPLPNDENLIPTLRGLQQCKIVQEQQGMNNILTELVKTRDEKFIPLISESVIEGMQAEFACRKVLEERTMANLAEDAALSAMLEEMQAIDRRMDELQKELDVKAKRMAELSENLWNTTVKNYGLTPEQRSYTLSNEGRIVKQVSLNCEKCPASSKIIELRKKLAAALVNHRQENA